MCTKTISAIMIVLLAAAWGSVCCCQSAWMADGAASLVARGRSAEADGCCRPSHGEPRECCPVGAKSCKSNAGKMLRATAVGGVTPTHGWLAWTGRASVAAPPALSAVPVRKWSAWESRPVLTLVGLGCALII